MSALRHHRCAIALVADARAVAPRPLDSGARDPRDRDRSEHYRRHAATQAAWAARGTHQHGQGALPRLIARIFKGRGL